MTKDKKIGVVIVGGTGYGAGELLRLLSQHPNVELCSVVSSSQAGSLVSDTHSHLNGICDFTFDSELNPKMFEAYERSVVFSALPHGVSAEKIPHIASETSSFGTKLIDLSGDFRLKDTTIHSAHYKNSSAAEALRAEFVYGLPELYKEQISEASYIANPGCYATTASLALAPLASAGYSGPVFIDGKSGTSGGGKGLAENFHHPKRHSSVLAYKVLEHRHEPEIQQALGDPSGERLQTAFVPHVLPYSRGIYVTAYLQFEREYQSEELIKQYQSFYKEAPFVRVRKAPPEIDNVTGSNYCDVSVSARGRQVVCTAVLDNLVKGMAGQAIQNMNIAFGLPEETGISQAPLGLV